MGAAEFFKGWGKPQLLVRGSIYPGAVLGTIF